MSFDWDPFYHRRWNRFFNHPFLNSDWNEPGWSRWEREMPALTGSMQGARERERERDRGVNEREGNKELAPFAYNYSEGMIFRPSFNVSETNRNWIISAELPGVKKDNINVEIRDGMLTICGHKEAEKKREGEQYRTFERSFGSFSRCLRLPAGIEAKDVQAKFDNGVLELMVDKPEGYESGGYKVPIQSSAIEQDAQQAPAEIEVKGKGKEKERVQVQREEERKHVPLQKDAKSFEQEQQQQERPMSQVV